MPALTPDVRGALREAGNWKLIAENYVDFYHVDAVHPELAKFSRVDDHQPYQGGGQYVARQKEGPSSFKDCTRLSKGGYLGLRHFL